MNHNLMRQSWKFIKANQISILTFLLVGGITTAMYFLIFGLLWSVLHLDYVFAVTIAYTLCMIFHFLANKHITFKNHNRHFNQVKKYLLMIGLNYLITVVIVSIIVELLHLSPYIGILTSVCITIFTTYLLSHFWVFASLPNYSRR